MQAVSGGSGGIGRRRLQQKGTIILVWIDELSAIVGPATPEAAAVIEMVREDWPDICQAAYNFLLEEIVLDDAEH